jgi:hypothetical protein
MAVSANDVIEATVIHENDTGGEQINRYQFKYAGPGPVDEADLLDDLAEILETMYGFLVNIITVRNVLKEVKFFDVSTATLLGSSGLGAYVGGTAASPQTAHGVSPFIYFPTTVPNVVLSKYFPNASEDRTDGDGRWTAATTVQLAAVGNWLLNDRTVNGRTYHYGYLSPKTATFVRPSSFTVRSIPAYQRRRKPNRGS